MNLNPPTTEQKMKTRLHPICSLILLIVSASLRADPLPRATPESQGLPTAAIRTFVETANQKINTLHSFMLLRHGQVIAEGWWKPEAAENPPVLHSLTKSSHSTSVGLVIEEGKLSLDDPILKFFPEDA